MSEKVETPQVSRALENVFIILCVCCVLLHSALPGVCSLVIHISDHGPWGLHHQPDNNSYDLTQIINIFSYTAQHTSQHSSLSSEE